VTSPPSLWWFLCEEYGSTPTTNKRRAKRPTSHSPSHNLYPPLPNSDPHTHQPPFSFCPPPLLFIYLQWTSSSTFPPRKYVILRVREPLTHWPRRVYQGYLTQFIHVWIRMATLSLQPSPHGMVNMNSRRAPLREAPSSVLNSPLRGASAAVVGSKRVRSHGVDQREYLYQYGPPLNVKRQAVQADSGDPRGFLRKTGSNPPTALQRKLEAVRDARAAKNDASKTLSEESLENIRQWQRHYRKLFPSFTFFFDSVPDSARLKVESDVRSLGAVSSSS
jgi:hypothetical protein